MKPAMKFSVCAVACVAACFGLIAAAQQGQQIGRRLYPSCYVAAAAGIGDEGRIIAVSQRRPDQGVEPRGPQHQAGFDRRARVFADQRRQLAPEIWNGMKARNFLFPFLKKWESSA